MDPVLWFVDVSKRLSIVTISEVVVGIWFLVTDDCVGNCMSLFVLTDFNGIGSTVMRWLSTAFVSLVLSAVMIVEHGVKRPNKCNDRLVW